MTPKTLFLLVGKSIAGDHEAFEQLLLSQKSAILFYIRRMTDCPEDAKDIHQEVSFRLYQNIGTLKRPDAFCPWLRTIVARECIRHLASRSHCLLIGSLAEWEPLLVETDSDYNPFARLERIELYSALESALGSLREPIRNMFHMRYTKEMRCRDIADSVGINTGAVAVTLFRAKEQLREDLQGRGISGV